MGAGGLIVQASAHFDSHAGIFPFVLFCFAFLIVVFTVVDLCCLSLNVILWVGILFLSYQNGQMFDAYKKFIDQVGTYDHQVLLDQKIILVFSLLTFLRHLLCVVGMNPHRMESVCRVRIIQETGSFFSYDALKYDLILTSISFVEYIPKTVFKPGVSGTRVNMVHHSKLLDLS